MNLLTSSTCDYNFSWGNTGKDLVCASNPNNVIWHQDGSITFLNKKETILAWYMDDNWNKVDVVRHYTIGTVVSKNPFYYGTYKLVCQLPNFRGSWPAFWFLDTSLSVEQGGNGMGIPPEIDVFEHFRKKGFWNRFKTTHTYHDKPIEKGKYSHMTCKAKRRLCPVDNRSIEFLFSWSAKEMVWFVDGKYIMTITPNDVSRYPDQPMNIILGSGIGNWDIDDNKLAPFLVKSLEII